MDLSGDFDITIWSERIGWWQYNYDLEEQFQFKSKRLARFIEKRYTISWEWTTEVYQAEVISDMTPAKWNKLYLNQF